MKKAWIKISTIWMVLVFMMIPIEAKVTEAIIDITGMSIKEIQEQVDLGMISYQEITQIYLDRIAAYAQLYDVVISVNPNVIEEATALDVQYQETGRTSDVFGIPILVKDNIDVKGMPMTPVIPPMVHLGERPQGSLWILRLLDWVRILALL